MKQFKNSDNVDFTTIFVRKVRLAFLLNTCLLVLLLTGSVNAQECNAKKVELKEKPVSELLKDYATKGDLQKIKELIEKDNTLINARLGKEETALTIAAYRGHDDVVEYLISKKADIYCRNDWNNNALMNAAMRGHVEIARLLIDNGANKDARGLYGNTALHFAAQEKRIEMTAFLVGNKCNIEAQNDYGQTPLFLASWNGKPEIIKILVDNGANVNISNSSNTTPLHNLASGGYAESIIILLNAGADVNKSDNDNNLPLHYAVKNGKPEAVKLLLAKTKSLNQKENHYGNTPLHLAAINGDLKSFRMLIEAGADYNLTNNQNQKAIDYAVKYGYTDLLFYCTSKNLASQQLLKQAEENRKALKQNIDAGNAGVYYCGHSGWAVNTKNSLLVFDYWSRNKISARPSLTNGTICPDELKNRKVFVFVSHDHSDHFDTIIYSWKKDIKDITYVFGFKPEKSWLYKKAAYNGPDYVYIENNQTKKIGNVKITTLNSNDTGQGFLVEVDGVSVYHPGDHALFTREDEEGFKKEVDFIANQNPDIDIAFLPVTGCPSRWKKDNIVDGFFYTINKLNPKQVYPMHAFQREYLLKEFADIAKERNTKAGIVCVENMGDNSLYNNKALAGQ
ncbi:MAG TPA: ankyrin repeat domain-containing protein [Bacteroidales bacterium]